MGTAFGWREAINNIELVIFETLLLLRGRDQILQIVDVFANDQPSKPGLIIRWRSQLDARVWRRGMDAAGCGMRCRQEAEAEPIKPTG